MSREVTCVCCPAGCTVLLDVAPDGAVTYRDGAGCARGRTYAVAEATDPVRTVATTVFVPGRAEPLSVRTDRPVPKRLLQSVVDQAKQLRVTPPVRVGDVLCEHVCGTDAALVATKSL